MSKFPTPKNRANGINRAISETPFHLVLGALGGALVYLGPEIGGSHAELIKIIGSIFIGASVVGIVSILRNKDFETEIENKIEQVLYDNLVTSPFYINVDEKYKHKLYLYHQTCIEDDPEVVIWTADILDFFRNDGRKRLCTSLVLANPRQPDLEQHYNVELVQTRGRIIMMVTNTRLDIEKSAIYVFCEFGFDNRSTGVKYHTDWVKNDRLSAAILSSVPIEGAYKNGPLDYEKLNEIWKKEIDKDNFHFSFKKFIN